MHPIITDVIINLALIFGIIIIGELTARFTSIKPQTLRKLMHIATGATVIFGGIITNYHTFVIVGLLMVAALALTRNISPLKSVRDRFSESQGEVYFALGTALAAGIAVSLTDFIACIAILSLADTAAYVVGRAVKSPMLTAIKSVAGSSACLIVTFAILLVLGYPWGIALTLGVYVAAAEILSTRGSDNATIPGLVAFLLAIISIVKW